MAPVQVRPGGQTLRSDPGLTPGAEVDMRWIAFVAGGLVVLIAGIAIIGSMLPRAHKASRILRVKRAPADVWPVVIQATQTSSTPVEVLESSPPHRLVTRVTEAEKNF